MKVMVDTPYTVWTTATLSGLAYRRCEEKDEIVIRIERQPLRGKPNTLSDMWVPTESVL